jgi:hypothetical protein
MFPADYARLAAAPQQLRAGTVQLSRELVMEQHELQHAGSR